jgi:hypothetical protein
MPPDAKDLLAQDNRPAILKELDNFNTAPSFGMEGILAEQLGQRAETSEPISEPEKEEREEAEEREAKEPDYERAYAPLNSSIQELGYRMDSRIADLERTVHDQRVQPQAQQAPQPIPYDPDAPVTMAHLVSIQQELQKTAGLTNEAQMRAEYLRAHLEYERFKSRNPDFALTPQEVDTAFTRFMANDLGRAKNTNWTGHFAQLYEQTQRPRAQARMKELEAKVEELTKKLSRKENAQPKLSPATATQPSPATRTVIESPATNALTDNDIINLPSFRKGKSFKSFGNDLKRQYGIK